MFIYYLKSKPESTIYHHLLSHYFCLSVMQYIHLSIFVQFYSVIKMILLCIYENSTKCLFCGVNIFYSDHILLVRLFLSVGQSISLSLKTFATAEKF